VGVFLGNRLLKRVATRLGLLGDHRAFLYEELPGEAGGMEEK
jgi:hypothetical protein